MPTSTLKTKSQTDHSLSNIVYHIICSMLTATEPPNSATSHTGEKCPVFTLPFELIATIFAFALADLEADKNELTSSKHRHTNLALILGSVCLKWRCITLECPWLWPHVEFTNKQHAIAGWPLQTRLLARSGTKPLVVIVDGSLCADDDGESIMQSILVLILPQAHRWRVLRVDTGSEDRPKANLASMHTLGCAVQDRPLPMLEELVMRCGWDAWEEGPGSPVSCWGGIGTADQIPSLKKVHLEKVPVDYRSPMFSNLQKLDIVDGRIGQYSLDTQLDILLDILLRSPGMKELGFIGLEDEAGVLEGSGPPRLPWLPTIPLISSDQMPVASQLVGLRLDPNTSVPLAWLLDSMKLPMLESSNSRLPPFTLNALPLLADISPLSRLTSFTVDGSLWLEEGWNLEEHEDMGQLLQDALRQLPLLQSISIECFDFAHEDQILRLCNVCPQLEELVLVHCVFPTIKIWSDVVGIREIKGCRALRKFEIWAPGLSTSQEETEADEREMVALRSLRKQIPDFKIHWVK